jgi:hypothetical protein
MSFVLAEPLMAIINTSIRPGVVPEAWKLSRITPLPKVTLLINLETDTRPIAITNVMAKVTQQLADQFFSEQFCSVINENQFGSVRCRSTTHTLIKVTHVLFHSSNNPHNFIGILLIDFGKAFVRTDRNILLQKFIAYDFRQHIVLWSLNFLADCKLVVKIGNAFLTPSLLSQEFHMAPFLEQMILNF